MLDCPTEPIRRNTVFVIGGSCADRAALCHSAAAPDLRLEPLASTCELGPIELKVADVFLVWNEPSLIEQVDAELAIACEWAPIVAFAKEATTDDVVRALEAGAVDFLALPAAPERLREKIQTVIRKGEAVRPQWQRALFAQVRLKRLTHRERQVISAVAQGCSNKMIARELHISDRTVEIHRANALGKLDARHSAEAIRLVFEAESGLALRIHGGRSQSASIRTVRPDFRD